MVHVCLFLSSGLCVLAGTLWQVVSRCNEHCVPMYVPFCSGQSAGHWRNTNANVCAWVCRDGGGLGGAKEPRDRSRCQIRLRIPQRTSSLSAATECSEPCFGRSTFTQD